MARERFCGQNYTLERIQVQGSLKWIDALFLNLNFRKRGKKIFLTITIRILEGEVARGRHFRQNYSPARGIK